MDRSDFVLLDNPDIRLRNREPRRLDMTVAIFCKEGTGRLRINMREITLSEEYFAIAMEGQILEVLELNEDFKGTMVLMSRSFLDSLEIDESFRVYLLVDDVPNRKMDPQTVLAIDSYLNLCRGIIEQEDNPHVLEILRLMTKAFFLGLGYYIHQLPEEEKAPSRSQEIAMRFMKLVERNYVLHRDLQFYADAMCLSPKYISMTVKSVSGRTATDWIDNYVVLSAKAMLMDARLTVAQISDHLEFPSQSFFGKYFKRVTGESPLQYRKRMRGKDGNVHATTTSTPPPARSPE